MLGEIAQIFSLLLILAEVKNDICEQKVSCEWIEGRLGDYRVVRGGCLHVEESLAALLRVCCEFYSCSCACLLPSRISAKMFKCILWPHKLQFCFRLIAMVSRLSRREANVSMYTSLSRR